MFALNRRLLLVLGQIAATDLNSTGIQRAGLAVRAVRNITNRGNCSRISIVLDFSSSLRWNAVGKASEMPGRPLIFRGNDDADDAIDGKWIVGEMEIWNAIFGAIKFSYFI